MYSLYKHKSPSGKVYVGITCQKVSWRWNNGRNYRKKDQPYFASAIEKYGWNNIEHSVLFTGLSEEKAKKFEVELIRFYKMLGISYNMTDGGDGHRGSYDRSHVIVSEETREKMRISHKGLFDGPNNPMHGKHETAPAYGKFGSEHPASKVVYQYDLDGNLIKKWDCISDAGRSIGKPVTNITAVCRGKKFTCGGFRWSYDYPYVINPEEKTRREEKRRRLSLSAKIGYATGKRRKMFGRDNPMYKTKNTSSGAKK